MQDYVAANYTVKLHINYIDPTVFTQLDPIDIKLTFMGAHVK